MWTSSQNHHANQPLSRNLPMMVLAIDDDDVDVLAVAELLRRVQPGKSRADNGNLLTGRSLTVVQAAVSSVACAQASTGCNRGEISRCAVARSTQRYSLCSGRPSASITVSVTASVCVRAR